MSSDKNPTALPVSKSLIDPQNPSSAYINPGNIDYSIIKNYFPNQTFPGQSFMNFPVDMNFQQNQNYQANNFIPNNDLRNIYYSNFTTQTNSTLTVNPPKVDNPSTTKQSNFSNYPPTNSFSPPDFSDSRNQSAIVNKVQYNNDKKVDYMQNKEDESRNMYNRNSQHIGSSNSYQRHSNFEGKPTSNFNRNRPEYQKDEIRMDWICPVETCRNRNFAKRDKCNLCKTPKPANPEYDNTEFPKKKRKEESRSKSRSRSGKREYKDKRRDKEKERERDKDRDRERDRDRDREREREKEKEKERDRDRDREKDRERDREKDREREGDAYSHKDRFDRSRKPIEDRRQYISSYNSRKYERHGENDRESREKKDLKFEPKGNDWECGKCRSNNYPHRTDCYKCGSKKYNNNYRESENEKQDILRKEKYINQKQQVNVTKSSSDNQVNPINSNDLGEFSKMLSQLSNVKGFGNDFNSNGMNSNITNNNANALFQMFQYLQSQGGNMSNFLHSITNNNTAFQNNRMNSSYNNVDFKGNQDSYKYEKKY